MTDTKATNDSPPADLQGDALAAWNRIRGQLQYLGKWKPDAHVETYALYCRTYALYAAAQQEVARDGPTMTHTNGIAGASPAARMVVDTAKLLRQLLGDLGLNPRHNQTCFTVEGEPLIF